MDWFIWAYGITAVVTAGMAFGSAMRDGTASLPGSLVVGALWPMMWVAAIVYAVTKK